MEWQPTDSDKAPRLIKVETYFHDGMSSGFPDKLSEACEWFQAKLLEIPEEHRDGAAVEVSSGTDRFGDGYITMEIYYWRTETAEEVTDRLKGMEMRARDTERRERAAYEALKAKYA